MNEPATLPLRMSRRTLLKAGVAGGAALLAAHWLYTRSPMPRAPDAQFVALDPNARAMFTAIVPVLLAGALPSGAAALAARDAVVMGVDVAIAGLPPAARRELEELFSLLSFAPSRSLVAGVWSAWPEASPAAIAAFLERWRDSRFLLLRSAYAALHQLVMAAWYGNERAWPAIGYPGPPSLAIG
ncbi:MAG: hypothetical protein ABI537_02340 [Casimicrobiaceae bacterium]